MLLHPYSIDRKEIKLKTFLFLFFHFLLRKKLDINQCWGYFTIPHELLAFDLWLGKKKIVYNVTIKPLKKLFIVINAFANIICHVLLNSRISSSSNYARRSEIFSGINQAHLKSENGKSKNPTEMFSRGRIYANRNRTLMFSERLSGKLNSQICCSQRKPLGNFFAFNLVS